jgi:hypothetical protein
VETIKDLDVDKFYHVLEGQGIVPAQETSSGSKARPATH